MGESSSDNVVIYGLSTEGYLIASSLASNKISTILVDEKLNVASKLGPETASTYSSARQLMEEESLLGIEPMDEAISKARALFFTPKIRKSGEEAKREVLSLLSLVSKCISRGTLIYSCFPVGIGTSSDIVSLIERGSGLKATEEFTYCYLPLLPRTKNAIAFGVDATDKGSDATKYAKLAGIKFSKILPIAISEIEYMRETLSSYALLASELESYRLIRDFKGRGELEKAIKREPGFVDDLADGLHDMKNIVSSLEAGEPSLYIASGIMRSMEGYARYLIDELKSLMKERGLKASRTRVTLWWSLDRFEMRGEKMALHDLLIEKVSDLIGDVDSASADDYGKSSGKKLFSMAGDYKTYLMIICSRRDMELVESADPRTMHNIVTLKANLICDR